MSQSQLDNKKSQISWGWVRRMLQLAVHEEQPSKPQSVSSI